MYKILKFGGSSIKTADRIKNIVEIVKSQNKDNCSIAIVVSAFGGITDKLISIANNIQIPEMFFEIVKEVEQDHAHIVNELGIKNSDNINSLFKELNSEIDEVGNKKSVQISFLNSENHFLEEFFLF